MSDLEKEMKGKWTIKEILEAVRELNERIE